MLNSRFGVKTLSGTLLGPAFVNRVAGLGIKHTAELKLQDRAPPSKAHCPTDPSNHLAYREHGSREMQSVGQFWCQDSDSQC